MLEKWQRILCIQILVNLTNTDDFLHLIVWSLPKIEKIEIIIFYLFIDDLIILIVKTSKNCKNAKN